MSASSVAPGSAAAVPDAPGRTRWELPVLGALAVLTFACVAVTIRSVPGGLPAHPLFVHVPVIFIPVTALGALILMARPRWLAGSAGPWIGLGAVIALGALDLTMNAGSALRQQLFHNAYGNAIVNEHATLAGQLRVIFIAFTAIYLITLAVHATAGGVTSGVRIGDRVFAAIRRVAAAPLALRALTFLLALLCLVWVYRVGDEGAKAVWYTRVHGGFGGGGRGHGGPPAG